MKPDLDEMERLADAADRARDLASRTTTGIDAYALALDDLADAAGPDAIRALVARARDAERYEAAARSELECDPGECGDCDERRRRYGID